MNMTSLLWRHVYIERSQLVQCSTHSFTTGQVLNVIVCYRSCLFQLLLLRHLTFTLEGSVAKHLSCYSIFSNSIITIFLLILTWNNFENWLIFEEVKRTKKTAIFGGGGAHPVVCIWAYVSCGNRWPWMTANAVMTVTLRYFSEFW